MDQIPDRPVSGWTFGKIIGLLLGLIGMVGFGVCTLCGFAFAVDGAGVWLFVFAGAVMTSLSVWLAVAMVRKARDAREGRNRNHP
jgi:hypothetical protein